MTDVRNAYLVTLAAAVVATAVCAAATAAAPKTQRTVFFPFRGSVLAPTIPIGEEVTGSCVGGSEVARRWDAWECTSGGTHLDPCFSSRRAGVGAIVACMESPWSSATLLELVEPLPLALGNVVGDPRRHAPWALTLANGERCALTQAPLGDIGGARVDYACAGSALLVGLPDRRRATWTIRRAATATKPLHRVAIRRAWW